MFDLSPYCLAFDLDGTLVDTAPDLIGALNAVLGQYGLKPLETHQARHLVGRGALALIRRGFELNAQSLSAEDERQAFDFFLQYYEAHIADHSKPFEEAICVLERLKNRGARLCVCTNKPQTLSEILLDRLSMRPLFETIRGADSVANKKPNPDHLKACCEDLGLKLSQTLLIGDSITDYETSRAAGVPSILFRFGYSDPLVDTLKADALLDHYAQLPEAIEMCIRAMPKS